MRVRMLEAAAVTVDGVRTVDAEAGDEVEMGDGVAASLIASGRAEAADGEAPKNEKPKRRGKPAAKENKDAGDADENKDGDEEPPAE